MNDRTADGECGASCTCRASARKQLFTPSPTRRDAVVGASADGVPPIAQAELLGGSFFIGDSSMGNAGFRTVAC